jgi:hypothetical protein
MGKHFSFRPLRLKLVKKEVKGNLLDGSNLFCVVWLNKGKRIPLNDGQYLHPDLNLGPSECEVG